jgi:hypothetical protein
MLFGVFRNRYNYSQNMCGLAADVFINLLLFWPCHNLTTLYFPSHQEREMEKEKLTKALLLSLRFSTSFLPFTCCTQRHKRTCKNIRDTAFQIQQQNCFLYLSVPQTFVTSWWLTSRVVFEFTENPLSYNTLRVLKMLQQSRCQI